MSYPLGVVTRTITVGDSITVESGTDLTVRATLRSSRGLVWVATGERAVSAPEVRESAAAGEAVAFAPPVTDQAGWRDLATGALIDVSTPNAHTHTYTIELKTLRDGLPVDRRLIGPFPLPTGDGTPVDADLLIAADTVPGLLVPDALTPRMDALESEMSNLGDSIPAAVADYLTANPPPAGDDGREIELQTTATHIQWRYVGDAAWTNLVSLAAITGDDGLSVELQTTATHIQWRLVGGTWTDLIALSALVGPAGASDEDVAALVANGGATTAALSTWHESRTIINALDYGVKADGVTNDAPAWNALVAACGPGDVLTWVGRSILDEPINWAASVSLVGQGWGRSVLAVRELTGTSYFPAIRRLASQGASPESPMYDCAFRDFEVDGSGLSGPGPNIDSKAIYAQWLKRVQFTNLYLHDTGATSLGVDYLDDCLIHGCVVENGGRMSASANGHAGIGIGMGAWAQEPVIISNNTLINNGHWGIFVEWQAGQPHRSKGARIIGNTVVGTRNIGIADRGCTGTLIQGNHVSGATNDGIAILDGASHAIVADNHIWASGRNGVRLENQVDNVIVSGNMIAESYARGIDIYTQVGFVNRIHITGNHIWDGGLQAIYRTGSRPVTDLHITGNQIWNNGKRLVSGQRDAIQLTGQTDRAVISGNAIYDTGGAGATQQRAFGLIASAVTNNLTITDNVIAGHPVSPAVQLSGTRTDVTVARNRGHRTEARETATIPDGASTVTIQHGLAATASHVQVTPQGNQLVWVQARDTVNITLAREGTSGALAVDWQAVADQA